MSVIILVIVLGFCLLLEGFFSGSEMAVVNADKHKLAASQAAHARGGKAAEELIRSPARFFSTTLFGTNVATVTGSVVVALYIIERYGETYAAYALLYWPATLIIGELVPKSLFHYYADKLVLVVSPLLLGISYLLYPIIWILSKSTEFLLAGVMERFGKEHALSREELELILNVGEGGTSDVKQVERTMVTRIFDLAEKKAANIMTPLVDIVALSAASTREEASAVMEEHGYSRIPVYDRRVYNVVGLLYGTDLLFGDMKKSVRELMHPPCYVAEEMPLDDLLISLKRRGESMAIVVNEYGGASGVVTIEDLLEEVVGEIRDEHDVIAVLYQRLGPRRFRVMGRMEVEAANEKLRLGLPRGGYETIAGFVVHLFARIPRVGEVMRFRDLQISVMKATERAVEEVEIVLLPPRQMS